MLRFSRILCLCGSILWFTSLCDAQVISDVVKILDAGPPPATHRIDFGELGTWWYSEPDLQVHRGTVGYNTLYGVSFGDILSPATIETYPIVEFVDIPMGDSYFGYASCSDNCELTTIWNLIGWVQFHRDASGLEVLSSAYSLGDVISPGIVAGTLQVPEPAYNGWLLLVLVPVLRRLGSRRI